MFGSIMPPCVDSELFIVHGDRKASKDKGQLSFCMIMLAPYTKATFLIIVKPGVTIEECVGSTVTIDMVPQKDVVDEAPPEAHDMLIKLPEGETAIYWNLTCINAEEEEK